MIFISYRRKDSGHVDALVAALEAEGLTVWLDRAEIDDAASIQRRIDTGLAEAQALLAWYSADYPKSRACQWELTAALIAAGAEIGPFKRLLVINPEATADHVQPVQVRDLQHLVFTGDYAALAQRIKAAVTPLVGSLGDLRRLTRPAWHGAHGLGSNRFVGRVTDLWAIHSALAAGNHAIVSGLPAPRAAGELAQVRGSGGIGKSLLAEEYALRFGAWWPGGVFWLRAYGNSDNPDEADEALAMRREAAYGSQLAGFAMEMGLDTRDKTDAQLRAELGRHLTQPYLWIVDDLPACGRDELERWLAPSSAGQTLVTTRSRRLGGLGAEIDLALLPRHDARILLTQDHPPRAEEVADVDRILVLLDDHALAVDVARAACHRLGYAGFRQRLEHPDHDALALAAEIARDLPNGHNPYIAATLLASLRQLDERGLDCLRLPAQLGAAPIPRDLLALCLAQVDGMVEFEAEDHATLGLQQALNHSLADEADGPVAYLVHTLVSRTMRHDDPLPQRQLALRHAALAVLLRILSAASDIRQHSSLVPYLPHAQALAGDATDATSLALAGWLGRHDFEGGRYRTASLWFAAEFQGLRNILGEQHPATLTSMNNLASTLRAQGDLRGARALEQKALAVRRRVLGEEHPATLTSMNNLASTLRAQGDLRGARALEEKVLEARRRVLGEEHPDTLRSMSNLASTLKAKGDLPGARALAEKALAARRRVLGEEHPDTLNSMNNLAETLGAQGDLPGARTLQEKVLEVCRRVLGEEHPNTLTSMNNLAVTLWNQGDLPGDRALQEKVLEVRRRVLGEEHPDTLTSMGNLASTLWKQGDLPGARALQEKVLEVRRRVLGEEHSDTLTSMNNLANTLWQQGEQNEANRLMLAAAQGCDRALGPDHPNTVQFRRAAEQMQAILDNHKKSGALQ